MILSAMFKYIIIYFTLKTFSNFFLRMKKQTETEYIEAGKLFLPNQIISTLLKH